MTPIEVIVESPEVFVNTLFGGITNATRLSSVDADGFIGGTMADGGMMNYARSPRDTIPHGDIDALYYGDWRQKATDGE